MFVSHMKKVCSAAAHRLVSKCCIAGANHVAFRASQIHQAVADHHPLGGVALQYLLRCQPCSTSYLCDLKSLIMRQPTTFILLHLNRCLRHRGQVRALLKVQECMLSPGDKVLYLQDTSNSKDTLSPAYTSSDCSLSSLPVGDGIMR